MVAPDLPGQGGTELDGTRGRLEQAVGHAARFLEPGSHVIGYSYGTAVALSLALRAPERVASLTLIEPVLFASLKAADPNAYARLMVCAMTCEPLFLMRWGPGGEWLEGRVFHPREVRIKRELWRIGAYERELFQGWDAEAVAGLSCPVLLIAGAEAPPGIARVLDVLGEALPRAARVMVPGAGHLAPISHPEPVAAAIRNFLDQSALRPE